MTLVTTPTQCPTGQQIHLEAGEYTADVVEQGAGLRTLTYAGRPVVAGYEANEPPIAGRGITLAPWPGRIDQGRYTWDGVERLLGWSEPQLQNAIHGLLHTVPWIIEEATPTSVLLSQRILPQNGYEFSVLVTMRYELDALTGLSVTASATNIGGEAAPFGFGAHPYLSAGSGRINECVAQIPAATALVLDARLIPTGTAAVADIGLDFRGGRVVGGQHVNHALTDLTRDANGLAWCSLTAPDGTASRLWADEEFGYFVVYSMDIPGTQARQGLAVEPQTCPPNAFVSGQDVIRLEPGQTWSGRYGVCAGESSDSSMDSSI